MDKLKLEDFDWGWMDSDQDFLYINGEHTTWGQYHKKHIIDEIYIRNMYEKFFEVEENDIVLDIGASNGPFTYSVLHKKPKHVYCLEPSEIEFPTLIKNTRGFPVTPINKGISTTNSLEQNEKIFGGGENMESITFDRLLSLYHLEKIDFLKIDCEGGEYSIFNETYLPFVKQNVRYIVGEWHLDSTSLKDSFRNFRDNFLKNFKKIQIFSVDGVDILWDLYNEHFIEYYKQIFVYIDNN